MFGRFHSPHLVDADNVIERDAAGENPGYDELGPTGTVPLAGDTSDDDGQALDDLFTPQPQGIDGIDGVDDAAIADPEDAAVLTSPRRVVPSPFGHRIELTDDITDVHDTDETTRILQARIPIGSGYDPQLLFPRDPNRLHLVITGDDDFQWGNSKSDVYAPGRFPGGLGLVLDKHTGAVWVYGGSIGGTAAATGSYVQAWCVTK